MKINQKKGIQLFLLFAIIVFLLFTGQLIMGLMAGSLAAAVVFIRIMLLLIIVGLIAFLWWLNKEADY